MNGQRVGAALILSVLGAVVLTACVDTGQPRASLVPTAVIETPAASQEWPTQAELAEVSDEGLIREIDAAIACEVYLERMDRGPRQGARGEVADTDANGLATAYTIAAGDNLERIADRFCFSWEDMYALHPPSTAMTAGVDLDFVNGAG